MTDACEISELSAMPEGEEGLLTCHTELLRDCNIMLQYACPRRCGATSYLAPADDVVLRHLPIQRHAGPAELLSSLALIPMCCIEGRQNLGTFVLRHS
jgi:hypothetical protein